MKASCLNEKSPGDLRYQGRVIYYNKKSRAAEHPSVTVRLIRICYDEVKDVQAEPVCLQYKWDHWYLIGYYEKDQDY